MDATTNEFDLLWPTNHLFCSSLTHVLIATESSLLALTIILIIIIINQLDAWLIGLVNVVMIVGAATDRL